MRIASLVPSGTDLVAWLGLGEHLVGVSHECDHPAAAGRPVLTKSRVPAAPETAPAEVDAAVNEAVAAGQPLYLTDREALAALAPDLVIAQDICDVCAVRSDEAEAALPGGARLVTLRAGSLDALVLDLEQVAEAAGVDPAPHVARFREGIDGAPRADGARRVLALEWGDPPFLGGHWVPELVERAGGVNVLATPGAPSRRATWDEIAAEGANVTLFMPCGYDLAQAAREAEGLPASVATPLWATDANRLFSRLTPDAAIGGLCTLAAILRDAPVPETDARRVRG